ncbi:PREDICTED: uncharacterized protein LOC109167858 [Ipomoea nil]|uniref:uncharacterized protein LOC109167858 n=1 Tax=Ipomoea nil TaxID=35883 RepID=UPI0009012D1A|nr:PREDICTED: uncharacterized protein LOC109167858 [Ipomoea nil]
MWNGQKFAWDDFRRRFPKRNLGGSLPKGLGWRYMGDLFKRMGMTDCKLLTTPASVACVASSSGELFDNPTQYRQLEHWGFLKRVFQYVKGTLDFGLRLCASISYDIHAFSYSDWASCSVDRKCTSGFVVFLGSNLISWMSRKQRTMARSSIEELADIFAF